ncbi:hypothetical protein ACH4UY_08720 [Streptomyces longwoodensis]|uniref:hypothetical protein n=1 Tax=Streptomyces longwoodensis TaxID=68231 RepID=UPI00379BD7E4
MLSPRRLSSLRRIGARLLHLVAQQAGADGGVGAVDADGFHVPHCAEDGFVGVVVRPDHHLFGTAPTRDGFARLVDDLEGQLAAPPTAAGAATDPAPTLIAESAW